MAIFPHFSELDFTFVRSSGPGGQNVNKVNSKAVLRWNVTNTTCLSEDVRARFMARYGNKLSGEGDLILSSDSYRDQGRNRDACIEKLKEMLNAVEFAPKKRKPTKMSWSRKKKNEASKSARSDVKKMRGKPSYE
ncbi:MAG: aminoacyl-tRNA hydrolase [Bdellovibrionales bacterium]|nr:aminoacyl-tRNA hydrolase [Oligoflexia bacterium]